MNTLTRIILALAFTTQLVACVPLVIGGVVAGGAMAIDRRSSGSVVDDEAIERKATEAMKALGPEQHVNVTSYNRNVLLTGEVPDEAAKKQAGTLAKSIVNVAGVTNELAIGPKSSLGDRTDDAYITSKIKTKFIGQKVFAPNRIKVVTEAHVVYLLGIVKTEEADKAVEIASTTDGVKKVVKIFEFIK